MIWILGIYIKTNIYWKHLCDEFFLEKWTFPNFFFLHLYRASWYSKFFIYPTDAQLECFKNFEIYIKIYIKVLLHVSA
jgi:hypothetical protein